MTAARTVIGALTTTFTQPAYCSNVVVACPYTCDSGWQAQECLRNGDWSYECEDATTCWPPASSGAPSPTPAFNGWGFYSPGFYCPAGWQAACHATAGGKSNWNVEYSMLAGETAIGCCPSGFVCDNGGAQTCRSIATSGDTIPVVTCSNGASISSYLAFPTKTQATLTSGASSGDARYFTLSTFDIAAPMVEIRWRSSDKANARPTHGSSSSSSKNTTQSGGLSTGAKAAIGVVVPVAVIAIIVGIIIFWRKKIQSLKQSGDWPNSGRASGTASGSATVLEQPSEVRTYRKPRDMREYQAAPQELEGEMGLREMDGSSAKPGGQ